MSSEGISKKRSRTSSNDGDDDDDASLYHQKSKRTPSAYIPAVSTASVVVSNRTPGDTVADDGRFRHALASSASGAQPTPSLSASKPVPYVWPRQKRDQVISLNCTPMRDGDTWYLISRTWYEKWQAACNPALRAHRREADDRLGPVDNSDIVGANGELILGLSEGSSVCCVSQRVMELFTQWYILFCILLSTILTSLSIPGMAFQSIPLHAKSSPKATIRQSASNSTLTR